MSSPAASPSLSSNADNSNPILTPSRRVKALLAQFDDSDSDNETFQPRPKLTTAIGTSAQQVDDPPSLRRVQSENSDESEDADEAIWPLAPRGRLAARLQTRNAGGDGSDSGAAGGGSAYERIKSQIQKPETEPGGSVT